MSRVIFWLGIGVLGLFLVGGVVWFFNHFAYKSEEIEVGYRGEARSNPLLAAERFLRQDATIVLHRSHSMLRLIPQLTAGDTVLLSQHNYPLNQKEAEQLMNWLYEQGGHLIVSADYNDNYDEANDYILSQLDLRLALSESEGDDSLEWLYSLELNEDVFNVEFFSNLWLEDTEDEHGTPQVWLQYHYGEGFITLFSDSTFMENDYIGNYDHAWFLVQLVASHRKTDRLFIVRLTEANTPSLPFLLWQQAWMVVISVAIVLFMLLWAYSQRFGPLLPPPMRERRRLLEHIEANGHFLWRHQRAEGLLARLREHVTQRVFLHYPQWHDLDTAQLAQRIAEKYNLSLNGVTRALHNEALRDEMDFTQRIQLLSQIKKHL
jgi:hypothetical protein